MFLSFIVSALFPLPLVGRVDVIWAANPNFFSMFPAIIYSHVYGAPIVRNVDDLWPEVVYDLGYVKSALFKKLLDFVAKITYLIPKTITPISKAYKQAIASHYNIDENKIFVIEHGVDSSLFYPIPLSENKPEASFVVMYSGKLGIAYDFDVVLESARRLAPIDQIRFVIRGFGERLAEIQSKIEEYGLDNVTVETDLVDIKELRTIFGSADAFLLPMKPLRAAEQGLPTKILEYQACGKPIICCSRGQAARYISLTRSGLTVDPGDHQALASAILKLYNNREFSQELGANGWKHISENLTIEKIGERMNEAFQEAKE
jgi:glycosyltransferase involved in cell wall biosynthesis